MNTNSKTALPPAPSFHFTKEHYRNILTFHEGVRQADLAIDNYALEITREVLFQALSEGFSYEDASEFAYKGYFNVWANPVLLEKENLLTILAGLQTPPIAFHDLVRLLGTDGRRP